MPKLACKQLQTVADTLRIVVAVMVVGGRGWACGGEGGCSAALCCLH